MFRVSSQFVGLGEHFRQARNASLQMPTSLSVSALPFLPPQHAQSV
jgi:hypothetical protein